ncbi:MAG TPA: VOC family protein [Gemmatimonadales bacterium]|nr:VOC family protein [Gemmatimonadales bacterium]
MGVSTHDIFGDAGGAQPATPGSYGEPPSGYRLPEGTRLGHVRLQIADLARSIAYYEETLGLRVLRHEGSSALLGAQGDDRPLVELDERAGARPATHRGHTGLFHFAILLPDRPSLGRFVRHVGEIDERVGAADHLVSESLYLQDPDNLGIEVYADRPRSTWRRIGRELMMATDPLDLAGLVRDAGPKPWTGMPAGTVMGHVHLHVGDLTVASAFYSEALGFDRTVWQYPGALFLAASGYHHHLGTNTWAGSGAKPPGVDEAQLLEWTIELPNTANLDAASHSLARAGYGSEWDNSAGSARALLTRDPWGTPVRLQSPTPPASGA